MSFTKSDHASKYTCSFLRLQTMKASFCPMLSCNRDGTALFKDCQASPSCRANGEDQRRTQGGGAAGLQPPPPKPRKPKFKKTQIFVDIMISNVFLDLPLSRKQPLK
jgi:hypothetical protein